MERGVTAIGNSPIFQKLLALCAAPRPLMLQSDWLAHVREGPTLLSCFSVG
jgi:hypothetical protein